MADHSEGPRDHISIHTDAPVISLGAVGWQKILLGGPRNESPLLLGITHVSAGQQSELIKHATPEIVYILKGNGHFVGDLGSYPFHAGDAGVIESDSWHAIHASQGEDVEMLFSFPQHEIPPTTRRADEQWK